MPWPPAYTLEVATFSFDNLHPASDSSAQSAQFAGIALQGLMRIPVGSLEAQAGLGVYASGSAFRGGVLFGASYTVPFIKFLGITFESRLTYVQDATPAGPAYWLDVGGSIGYPF